MTQLSFCFVTVFLGVTDLQAHQVETTSLCARWQIHRHATAYRIVLESLQGKYSFVKCLHAWFCANHGGQATSQQRPVLEAAGLGLRDAACDIRPADLNS